MQQWWRPVPRTNLKRVVSGKGCGRINFMLVTSSPLHSLRLLELSQLLLTPCSICGDPYPGLTVLTPGFSAIQKNLVYDSLFGTRCTSFLLPLSIDV